MARKILLGIGAVLLACLLMEEVLRLTDSYEYEALVYDKENGLIHYEPGSTYHSQGSCYDVEASMNSIGLYGPEVAPKEKDVYRIIIVGSSFVEGIQIPLEERFDTILEQELNARHPWRTYEVAALGFPANGTYLNLLYYKEYMQELNPDLVIDLMTDFDLGKDAPTTVSPPRFTEEGETILELPKVKRNELVIQIKSIARQSKLFEVFYERYLTLRTVVHEQLHPEAVATQSDEGTTFAATWETEARLFRDFKKLVEESDARFMVASWTTGGHEDRDFVGKEMRPIAAREGLTYLDLAPALDAQAQETGRSPMLSCEGHWGSDGHAWVADTLADYLILHAL